MSNIGELNVKIGVDDKGLDKGLKGAGDDVTKFDKKTQKKLKENLKAWGVWAKSATESLGGVGNMATSSAKVIAGGVTAGTVAFLAFAETIAASEREMATLARQSGMAVDEFKALSFATKTVGVDADQLSGQLEDTRRKLAEFSQIGTGAFQDYADIMKLNTEEAKKLAGELAALSGKDAVLMLTENMEKAQVPTAAMGHVLDSLGSDMDRLLPLLRDGGREVTDLSSKFSQLTIAIEEDDLKSFEELSQSMGILTANFKTFLTEALSPLAPMFEDAVTAAAAFFKSLTEESREADRIAEVQEKINGLLDKQVKSRRSARSASRKANKEDAQEAVSAQNQLSDLVVANNELINTLKNKEEASKRSGHAGKLATEWITKNKDATLSQISANELQIKSLANESEKAKEVLSLYQQIGIAKESTKADIDTSKIKELVADNKALNDAIKERAARLKLEGKTAKEVSAEMVALRAETSKRISANNEELKSLANTKSGVDALKKAYDELGTAKPDRITIEPPKVDTSQFKELIQANEGLIKSIAGRKSALESSGISADEVTKGLENYKAATLAQVDANNKEIVSLVQTKDQAQALIDTYKELGIAKPKQVTSATIEQAEAPESALVQRTKDETDKYVAALRDRLGQTQDNLKEGYDKEIDLLNSAIANKSISDAEGKQRALELEAEYLAASDDLKNKSFNAEKNKNDLFVAALRDRLGQTIEAQKKAYEQEKEMLDASVETGSITLEEANQRKLELYQEYYALKTEIETVNEDLSFEDQKTREQARYDSLKATLDNMTMAEKQAAAMSEKIKVAHDKKMAAISKKEDKAKISGTKNALSNVASLMNSGNKTLFAIGKAAAMSNALISAKESVVHAYKAGAQIGGPVLGAAFGGAAAIAQGVNVASIAGQSYGGGGSPTSYNGGVPTVNTSSQQDNTQTQPTITEERVVRLDLAGSGLSDTNMREFIEQFNEAIGDGVTVTGMN